MCTLLVASFRRPLQVTVRSMLLDRCLSVCNVGVLWPNGWMDQDATSYGGRRRPRRRFIRWEPSSFCAKKGIAVPLTFRLVGWLEFNVPFQHKYGYIRDDLTFQLMSIVAKLSPSQQLLISFIYCLHACICLVY